MGLAKLTLTKRNGKFVNYDMIVNKDIFSSSIESGDNNIVEFRNLGQASSLSRSEVVSFSNGEDSGITQKQVFATPIMKNGVIIPESKRSEVGFVVESIITIEPFKKRPFSTSPVVIYVKNIGLNAQQPNSYVIPYTVEDVWYYLQNGEFPVPYYGESFVLGGETFQTL